MTQTAVITGASRGIGLETARHLVGKNWSVVICSRNGDELQEAVAGWSAEARSRTLALEADVSKPEQLVLLADATRHHFGKVKALISNAGLLGPVGKLSQVDVGELTDAMNVNFMGFVNLYQAFAPLMKNETSSRFIALAGGGLGGPDQIRTAPMYVPSKAALVALIELLVDEVRAMGGTINAIAPGNIPTTFLRQVLSVGESEAGPSLFHQAKNREGMEMGDSMYKYLQLLEFLLSDESDGITGRFLSARWDEVSTLTDSDHKLRSQNLYRLRRVDNDLFVESGEV